MKTLFAYAFDLWNGFWFYVGEVIDSALDVWGDDDPEDWGVE